MLSWLNCTQANITLPSAPQGLPTTNKMYCPKGKRRPPKNPAPVG